MERRAAALPLGLMVLLVACAPSGRTPPPGASVPSPGPAVVGSIAPTIAPTIATSTSTASPTASAIPVARPAASSGAEILRSAIAVEAAARLPLRPGTEVVVDPSATFEVELSTRASDARLVLVDARDDLVPASATREIGPSTRLTLAPAAPLVPGSRYVLRLDGASDRELHDDGGRAFSAVTLPLLAAGSPPPPEKKPGRKKRRR